MTRREWVGGEGGARREGRASQEVALPVLRQRWRGARPGSGWDRVDRRRVRSRPAPPHSPRAERRELREIIPCSLLSPQSFSLTAANDLEKQKKKVTPICGDVGHPHALLTLARTECLTALAHAHRFAPTVARCPRAAAQPGGLPGGLPVQDRRDESSPGGVPT